MRFKTYTLTRTKLREERERERSKLGWEDFWTYYIKAEGEIASWYLYTMLTRVVIAKQGALSIYLTNVFYNFALTRLRA